jgi:hypothetical protein
VTRARVRADVPDIRTVLVPVDEDGPDA